MGMQAALPIEDSTVQNTNSNPVETGARIKV